MKALEPSADRKDFFGALGGEDAQDLRARGTTRRFARGAALFHEDQLADRVFLLLSGHVKLTCVSEEGRELMLALRGPGDVLGELSAVDGSPRSATAVALQPVEAQVVSATDFSSFLEQRRTAALALVRILCNRLREADKMRLEFATQDSVGRVAARLTELCDQFGKPDGDGVLIDLSLSQEELASWTACSREAVSKALTAMRRLGWVETRRRSISVLDREALRKRAFAGA